MGVYPYLCKGGEEAVKVFQDKYKATCCSNKFSFVFTDIQMPIMDGFRVAECLRATEMAWASTVAKTSQVGRQKSLKSCKICAVTANFCDGSFRTKCKRSGINSIIRKPVSM